jgi:hypothetical protein
MRVDTRGVGPPRARGEVLSRARGKQTLGAVEIF